jgi:DNA-binding MarR family transcriptional regulator
MVVKSRFEDHLRHLDLAYRAFFLGRRVNELVTDRTRKAGFIGVRESHGYLIQHLIESDRTVTELARRMGVTQQAASKAIAELIRLKIVEVVPESDRRVKRIRLSNRGWRCVQLGRRTRAQIDNRLTRVVGRKSYEHATATLLTCLQTLGGIETIRARRIPAPR